MEPECGNIELNDIKTSLGLGLEQNNKWPHKTLIFLVDLVGLNCVCLVLVLTRKKHIGIRVGL